MSYSNLNNLNSLSGLGTGSNALAFTPSSISGLKLWVDANKGTTTDGTTPCTNGQGLAFWADQSGNSNTMSSQGGSNNPIFNTNIQNGLSGITFAGAASQQSIQAIFTYNDPEHIFMVVKQVTWTQFRRLVARASASGNMKLINDVATPGIYLDDGTNTNSPGTTGMTLGTFFVLDFCFNGASSTIRLNNGSNTTGNPGSGTNMGGVTIGADYLSGTGASNIVVGELLAYDSHLSDANASLVNHYLGTKWGITVS